MTDEERQFRIPDAPGMTDNGRIMKLADYVSKLQAWGEQCQWTARSILQSYDELKAENAALQAEVERLRSELAYVTEAFRNMTRDRDAAYHEIAALQKRLSDFALETLVSFEGEVSIGNETIEHAKAIMRELGREKELPWE